MLGPVLEEHFLWLDGSTPSACARRPPLAGSRGSALRDLVRRSRPPGRDVDGHTFTDREHRMNPSNYFTAAGVNVVSAAWYVTVPSWSRAVVIRDGKVVAEQEPGRYRRRSRSEWHLVDQRPALLTIPPQEVLTSDGVQVRLSVIATLTVVNPTAWVTASQSPIEVIYSHLQVTLRDRVAALDLAELSTSRATILDGVESELAETYARIGVSVTAIAVKDITLPQEVRSVLAQVALTKQRGLAELERARGEAASLRSLANTAKLLTDNPALLQLRTLQAATEGAQIVIHRGEGETR